ncbi:TetR/AcrR family transcriptional regulator [Kocuria sp. cx-455]|uniref:TetR/AcrR family transcriptional regulator n=1 Tax=Kocuria sp. cx-455 TaxID=2771377 RepID=UPI001682A1E8|nr:TetR/AcrR family transcriptional regulator [Kocuria sp. cx-455]MBD2765719.1 TetR/AcrR family transcriptional regulator [Kocuria sp. cx-455]
MIEQTAHTAEEDAEKRSRTATRRRLVTASAGVFAEKGIDGASVGELCAAAGFTRGAFYSNFATKLDLAVAVFEDLVDSLIDRLDSGLEQWLDSDADTQEVVTRIIEGVTDQTANMNVQAVRLELFLAAFRSPEVRDVVRPLRNKLYGAVETALGRVAESQHLEFTIPAADMTRLMLTSYSGQLTDRMAVGDITDQKVIPTMWLAFTRPAGRSES